MKLFAFKAGPVIASASLGEEGLKLYACPSDAITTAYVEDGEIGPAHIMEVARDSVQLRNFMTQADLAQAIEGVVTLALADAQRK